MNVGRCGIIQGSRLAAKHPELALYALTSHQSFVLEDDASRVSEGRKRCNSTFYGIWVLFIA